MLNSSSIRLCIYRQDWDMLLLLLGQSRPSKES